MSNALETDRDALLDKAEAKLEVMLLMAKADGVVSRPEMLILSETIISQPEFRVMSKERTAGWIRATLNLLDHVDRLARLAEIRRRLPKRDDRINAIWLALDIIEADGIVHVAEKALLKQMVHVLELKAETLEKIQHDRAEKRPRHTVFV